MEIRKIDKANGTDLNLKNDPFPICGRMIPGLKDGVWSYEIQRFADVEEMTFPDYPPDFDELNRNGAAFGAYENDMCVGNIILKNGFFDYMYVEDLRVSAQARGKGVGKALIRGALAEAVQRGYRGLYLQAQDNNLNACLFYLACGFQIGGFDNRVYAGTKQAGKADIFFYLDKDT